MILKDEKTAINFPYITFLKCCKIHEINIYEGMHLIQLQVYSLQVSYEWTPLLMFGPEISRNPLKNYVLERIQVTA